MSKKYLYYFSEGNDAFGGDKVTMKNTLGGKGAGLAEMTAAGMPVPQGFTITTDACTQYYADGRQINDDITADIFEHLKGLEEITGKKFGDNTNPLLVSVRSGARQSMPGMMDTILNLGLNDEAVEGLAKKTGNARFAYDCYRRFVQMFAELLAGDLFQTLEVLKNVSSDGVIDLTAVCVVLGAGVGGDGEALRHRHTGCGHFCQTSTLAAQSILHGDFVAAESIIAFAEVVQILFAHALFTSHS